MGFIIAPTVLTMLDNSIDTSIFYSSAEEEEKGSEKEKNIEILFAVSNTHESNFKHSETVSSIEYVFKAYAKPYLNLISPPPDLG